MKLKPQNKKIIISREALKPYSILAQESDYNSNDFVSHGLKGFMKSQSKLKSKKQMNNHES